MAVKTLQQVLETHDQIVQRFEQHRKTLSRARPAGSDLVVKQKRRLLANLDERLDNARAARAESIKRHDAEIARIELSRTKLAEEIAADEKNLGGSGGGPTPVRPTPEPTRPTPVRPTPVRPTPVRPTPTRPTRPTGGAPVDRVKGIGKVFGSRLERESIRTAGDLAAADPAKVAKALSISESRAQELVRAASKVK
jgi:hypothetical protein